jgi:creatinine amidohydrolase
MTWPEVQDLLTRTDMVIIPVPALEQHGPQTPIGTDFLSGVERAKLIAQRTDVLVAPVIMAGSSPYHMGFPGTITISTETLEKVYFETVQSLIHHGFRRIIFMNAHTGNQFMTSFVADRVNQETAAIAVELTAAVDNIHRGSSGGPRETQFDRHGGVAETSGAMYLFPNLVQIDKGAKADLTLPEHMNRMMPQVIAGDPVALQVFLAEGLKPKDTGKHTSTREMSNTGSWSERDTRESTAAIGRAATESFVNGAVEFINRWKALRPLAPLSERQAQ